MLIEWKASNETNEGSEGSAMVDEEPENVAISDSGKDLRVERGRLREIAKRVREQAQRADEMRERIEREIKEGGRPNRGRFRL